LALAELISTPNIEALEAYQNIFFMTQEARKI
jgi:hypothetical protein